MVTRTDKTDLASAADALRKEGATANGDNGLERSLEQLAVIMKILVCPHAITRQLTADDFPLSTSRNRQLGHYSSFLYFSVNK